MKASLAIDTRPINSATVTPMMRQYYELKDRCGEAILFFRMGDFYEIFGDDAQEVAPKLEIMLTSRERGDQQKIPFCGVPHHSAQAYWLKLLKQGYKVAIADQMEEASQAKGLVRREITRTLTPGCIDELEGLVGDRPNYLFAAYENPEAQLWAIALADISTGELRLGQAKSLAEVISTIEECAPQEVLIRRFCVDEFKSKLEFYLQRASLSFSYLPEAILRDADEQDRLLREVFAHADIARQPAGKVVGGSELIAALFQHCKGLQASLKQFLKIAPFYDPESIILGESVIRDLELFETSRGRKNDGSLFKIINFSQSPMGARMIRHSLAHPLGTIAAISERHEAVGKLLELPEQELLQLRKILQGMTDLERLTTRLAAGTIRPMELAGLRNGLAQCVQLVRFVGAHPLLQVQGQMQRYFASLRHAMEPYKLLNQALADQPLSLGEGNQVFRRGFDQDLDAKVALALSGEEKVEAYLEELRQSTSIQSLKIKDHKTFGLTVEVTKTNLKKVPADFIRRQTMVNCERFTTMALKELDETLAGAKDQAIAREAALYTDFLRSITRFHHQLQELSQALGLFDMLQSFAWLAARQHYCRPRLTSGEEASIELKACRHPVVEHFVGFNRFVANDIYLSAGSKQLLITGPNMAGKSTVMRQIALAAILNQAGCFVPAQSAVLPVFDGIFTRVGASDDLSRGMSTFMVEMTEAANILRYASSKSLVILDEVGRGTSSADGLAIAAAILENLARKVNCWTLFATHYHELVAIAESLTTVKAMQTEVREQLGQGIAFSHRLIPGACGRSFGIEVATLAGIPQEVVSRAKAYLLDAALSESLPAPLPAINPAEENWIKLAARIEQIEVDATTPLQALKILNDLKGAVAGKFPVDLNAKCP